MGVYVLNRFIVCGFVRSCIWFSQNLNVDLLEGTCTKYIVLTLYYYILYEKCDDRVTMYIWV